MLGSGWVAMCSTASASLWALIVNNGGSSEYSQPYFVGGKVMDVVSITLSLDGGDAGGVTNPRSGTGPGGHTGMCLFGIAWGVPRDDVFSDRCGGGVEERAGMGGALATTAAMAADSGCHVYVQLKARNVRRSDLSRKGRRGVAKMGPWTEAMH